MSKYTTGEVAKLCGVTVRTVQYYDTRGILIPSGLSEGGRRLYSEEDVGKMRIICFLRGIGFSIDAISRLFSDKDPSSVIVLLLEQQEQTLKVEIAQQKEKLDKMETLKKELKSIGEFSVESIGDIANTINSKTRLRKVRTALLLTGIPVSLLQWGAIVLVILTGIWWPLIVWGVIAAAYGIWSTRYYFRNTSYICPQCHTVFRSKFKEMFFAPHTPRTRKLRCPSCGHHGYCVETASDPLPSKNET